MEVDAGPQLTPGHSPSEETNDIDSSLPLSDVPYLKEEDTQDSPSCSDNITTGNYSGFSLSNKQHHPAKVLQYFPFRHQNILSQEKPGLAYALSPTLDPPANDNEHSSPSYETKFSISEHNIPSDETNFNAFSNILSVPKLPHLPDVTNGIQDYIPPDESIRLDNTPHVSNWHLPESIHQGSPNNDPSEESNDSNDNLSMPNTIETEEHQSKESFSEVDSSQDDQRSNTPCPKKAKKKEEYSFEDRKNQCNVCGRSYRRKRDLARHLKVHSGELPYECHICGLVYQYKAFLSQHIAKHTGEKRHACKMCEEKFFGICDLEAHVQKAHPEVRPFQCETCKNFFKTRQNLKKHYKTHTEEKQYHCDQCGKKFRTTTNLKFHLRVHFKAALKSNPLSSGTERKECEKIFQDSLGLPLYPEKRYKCDQCGNKYSSKFNLMSHQMTHSGDFPFQCQFCGKKFCHNSFLQRHIRIHTGEKPYKCDICGNAYNCSNDLKSHSVVHTGEQPFKCDICQKSFSFKSSLNAHLKIHSGERNYKCDVCNREFMCSYSMVLHKRTHSGERSYQCDMCDKAFFNTSNLNHHRRRAHGWRSRKPKNKQERETSMPVNI